MSAFDVDDSPCHQHKASPFDESSTAHTDDRDASVSTVGVYCTVPHLGSNSSGASGDNAHGLPRCMAASPTDLGSGCLGSPFSQSHDGGATRMSKMNRLRLQMGLSIGDASTYQTHHRDEAHATPVAAAACEGMTQINDFMFLGSWRDSAEAAASTLQSNGITHILNLAREHSAEGEPEKNANLQFITIPMNDDHQENFYDRLLEAHDYINACKAGGGKVLVHCRRGISRSPAIVVSYLMRYGNMSYNEAYEFVLSRRRVSLNLAFREFLGSWDPALGRPPTSARKADDKARSLSQMHT